MALASALFALLLFAVSVSDAGKFKISSWNTRNGDGIYTLNFRDIHKTITHLMDLSNAESAKNKKLSDIYVFQEVIAEHDQLDYIARNMGYEILRSNVPDLSPHHYHALLYNPAIFVQQYQPQSTMPFSYQYSNGHKHQLPAALFQLYDKTSGHPLDILSVHFKADYGGKKFFNVRKNQATAIAEWYSNGAKGMANYGYVGSPGKNKKRERRLIIAGDINENTQTGNVRPIIDALGMKPVGQGDVQAIFVPRGKSMGGTALRNLRSKKSDHNMVTVMITVHGGSPETASVTNPRFPLPRKSMYKDYKDDKYYAEHPWNKMISETGERKTTWPVLRRPEYYAIRMLETKPCGEESVQYWYNDEERNGINWEFAQHKMRSDKKWREEMMKDVIWGENVKSVLAGKKRKASRDTSGRGKDSKKSAIDTHKPQSAIGTHNPQSAIGTHTKKSTKTDNDGGLKQKQPAIYSPGQASKLLQMASNLNVELKQGSDACARRLRELMSMIKAGQQGGTESAKKTQDTGTHDICPYCHLDNTFCADCQAQYLPYCSVGHFVSKDQAHFEHYGDEEGYYGDDEYDYDDDFRNDDGMYDDDAGALWDMAHDGHLLYDDDDFYGIYYHVGHGEHEFQSGDTGNGHDDYGGTFYDEDYYKYGNAEEFGGRSGRDMSARDMMSRLLRMRGH